MQDRFLLGYTGAPAQIHAEVARPGWLLPIGDFLSSLGRRKKHATTGAPGSSDDDDRSVRWLGARNASSNVQLVNAGFAGHKLDAYLSCLATKVPVDSDLFIVDAATVTQSLVSAEQVVRSLLALPNSPAVLFVHFANWCWHQNQNDPDTRREHLNRSCYRPQRAVPLWRKANEYEASLDELNAYYSLPSVSLRRAFGRAALHAAEDPLFKPWQLTGDGLHPQRPGCNTARHPQGCPNERYAQLTAAAINSFFWDAWNAMHADEKRYEAAPGPAAGTATATATATAASTPTEAGGSVGGVDGPSPLEIEERTRLRLFPCLSLYPPHLRPGRDGQLERCFAWGPDLQARPEKSLAPILPQSRGFNFTEFDTAVAADARTHCAVEKARRTAAQAQAQAQAAQAAAAQAQSASVDTSPPRGGSRATPGAPPGGHNEVAQQASDAGHMPRGGGWNENMCVKRLRIKSRPGLTAFSAGSVAYIEVTLDAAAAAAAPVGSGAAAAPVGSDSAPSPVSAVAVPAAAVPAAAVPAAAVRASPVAASEPIEHAEVTLTYLSSYEAMGVASLRCTHGCVCDPTEVDAHRGEEVDQRLVSVYRTLTFSLRLDPQRRCVLRLEVLNTTRSTGNKFKVSEIALVASLPTHAAAASPSPPPPPRPPPPPADLSHAAGSAAGSVAGAGGAPNGWRTPTLSLAKQRKSKQVANREKAASEHEALMRTIPSTGLCVRGQFAARPTNRVG